VREKSLNSLKGEGEGEKHSVTPFPYKPSPSLPRRKELKYNMSEKDKLTEIYELKIKQLTEFTKAILEAIGTRMEK